MMYDEVAKFYDALVKDDEATKQYVAFVERYAKDGSYLELACGSGELSLALANNGKQIEASDLSQPMLEEAKKKDISNLVHFFELDMRRLNVTKKYDNILCFCDSLNYLNEEDLLHMFKNIYKLLNDDGVFMFDMHSVDRLAEFSEEFYEAGKLGDVEYSWSILREDSVLCHNFMFFDEDANPTYEQHIQNVFDVEVVSAMLKEAGFQVELYTDFVNKGIQEGEKYFIVARKERV